MDPEIKILVEIMLKSHNKLTEALIEHVKSTNELDIAVVNLTKTVDAYVKTSQERIIFVEKQLDTLINSLFPDRRIN